MFSNYLNVVKHYCASLLAPKFFLPSLALYLYIVLFVLRSSVRRFHFVLTIKKSVALLRKIDILYLPFKKLGLRSKMYSNLSILINNKLFI